MYIRVIPRDLFNEANLLKCFGQLYLCLETLNPAGVSLDNDGEPFDIDQNPDDGSLFVRNVVLTVRGETMRLQRPLNSRQPWPLYLDTGDTEYAVFDDAGKLTSEFLSLL